MRISLDHVQIKKLAEEMEHLPRQLSLVALPGPQSPAMATHD